MKKRTDSSAPLRMTVGADAYIGPWIAPPGEELSAKLTEVECGEKCRVFHIAKTC